MNRLISISVVLLVVCYFNPLIAQDRADHTRVKSVSAAAAAPSISADHNAADARSAEDQRLYDLRNQWFELSQELEKLEYNNLKEPNADRTAQIADLRAAVSKLEKELGIN